MPTEKTDSFDLIDQAIQGNKQALEQLLLGIQDMVYNLSLRMLGNPQDAEDAAQEIYIRILTGLSGFKKESAFSTWAYRVASNHLLNYKKSMFAKMPSLSFELYGADIEAGFLANHPDAYGGVDENLLTEELKMSCTNVMLQCFEPENRLIYVLGNMFCIDSKLCSEILGLTPESYRKRLSRLRKKMKEFLSEYCGLSGTGRCNCQKRVGYAIQNHRLHPAKLEYTQLLQTDKATAANYCLAMENLDTQSLIFTQLPEYRSPQAVTSFLQKLINSEDMKIIQQN